MASGLQRRSLHDVPVGIKDQFDTVDMATAYGSSVYEGHRPMADAESGGSSYASVRIAQLVDFDLRSPEELERPMIAFVKTPWWRAADETTRDHLERLAIQLSNRGALVEEIELPAKSGNLI